MPAKRSSGNCRLRKVACPDCGYVARIARSWLEVGLPGCPCGGVLEPESPADRAFAGLVSQDDVPAVMWTEICRENGWDDAIVRRGNAFKAWQRNPESRLSGRRVERAAHCAHPGCGLWVAVDASFCAAGHAQSDDVEPAASSMPF